MTLEELAEGYVKFRESVFSLGHSRVGVLPD